MKSPPQPLFQAPQLDADQPGKFLSDVRRVEAGAQDIPAHRGPHPRAQTRQPGRGRGSPFVT